MSIGALPVGEPALAQQGLVQTAKQNPPGKRVIVATRDIVAQPEPR